MDLWKAIKHLHPNAQPLIDYELRDDGAGPYIAIWRLEADQPTPEEITTAIAAYDAQRETERTAATALRNQVRSLANGAAGKLLTDLTAAEVRALLAVLLWKSGGVNASGTIKALSEWAN